jgi:ATP-dependent Lhr-like helicase
MLSGSGAFPGVTQEVFITLLRQLGTQGVIEQADDGTLLPGPTGEQLLAGRDIYSVFISQEEFRVISTEGQPIGQVPIDNPITPGQFLLLGGRRWQVIEVFINRREILVGPARGGKPPVFFGEKPLPTDGVIEEMRRLYEDATYPIYLNSTAKRFVSEGRETFDRNRLRQTSIIRYADSVFLIPWVGGPRLNSLFLVLSAAETEATLLGISIFIPERNETKVKDILTRVRNGDVPPAEVIAKSVKQKAFEKFDYLLGDPLLILGYASERLDVASLPLIAADLLDRW